MTRVSRRPLPPSLKKKLTRNFLTAINDLSDAERTYFLDRILTPVEKIMLAKRLAILEELGKGSTYVEIEERFKVISVTVSRMNKVLRRSGNLLKILSKIYSARRKRATKRPVPRRRVAGSRTVAGSRRIFGF